MCLSDVCKYSFSTRRHCPISMKLAVFLITMDQVVQNVKFSPNLLVPIKFNKTRHLDSSILCRLHT